MRLLGSGVMVSCIVMLLLTTPTYAELAVIVHPDNQVAKLERAEVEKIYLGAVKFTSHGERLQPVDQTSGSKAREEFYHKVADMDEGELRRYWSRRKFSGKGKQPVTIGNDHEVKEWVSHTPNGIGYIDNAMVDETVKPVYVIH